MSSNHERCVRLVGSRFAHNSLEQTATAVTLRKRVLAVVPGVGEFAVGYTRIGEEPIPEIIPEYDQLAEVITINTRKE